MIVQFLSEMGAWSWLAAGLLLLIAEILAPGVFLVWFGLAALLVGTVTLTFFDQASWWSWQVQIVAFGILSFIFVFAGIRLFPTNVENDAASKMNDPLGRFVGQVATLDEAIENGAGHIHLGDTQWRVTGEDMPGGTKVRVVSAQDGALMVEAA